MQASCWVTIPNMLTGMRMVVTPCVGYAITVGAWGTATILFFVCGLSDFLDGFIARSYQQQTFLGSCLDPLADKFLVISSFYALSGAPLAAMFVPTWFIALMVAKEVLLVVGVLYFCFGLRMRIPIRPSLYGKVAAATQMVSLCWILIASYLHSSLGISGEYLFLVLAVLMISALLEYGYKVLHAHKEGAL